MAVRIESQAEPIPGYRLIERLGGGGFGEVWKAEAPGGLHKAIKFVYGNLQTAGDEEGVRAEQELKAMSRVKTVRHPYILSLERYDIIDGQLIIVMELADRNLWDRFRECRAQGLPGIPRAELHGYMAEIAEALDLMNKEYQLQHLDIKPQNLFLVHNHVKVADFGLVKDLEGMVASVTGGVTPVYAAPETFDGWVSRYCDQYSLAIVYQELLTGQRPFACTTVRQLVLQHLQGVPDLSSLPVGDREPIARALAKNPEQRHPNCHLLVQALHDATLPVPGVRPPALPVEGEITPARPFMASGDANAQLAPTTPRPPRGMPATGWLESGDDTPRDEPPSLSPPASAPISSRTSLEVAGGGVLFPALVIGLGNIGLEVLKRVRASLAQRFGPAGTLPQLRLLSMDTDAETVRQVQQGKGDTELRLGDVLLTPLHRPSHYLKPREGKVRVDTWLNPKMLYRIPRQAYPQGCRALGRLAFVDNYRSIALRLRTELEQCTDPDALDRVGKETGLGMRSNRPRVYVVTSLAGGTGSGMFLDLAYVVRALVRQMGYDRPEVIGLFLVPRVGRPAATAKEKSALANAYAALTELNHFSMAGTTFSARYETPDAQVAGPITDAQAPFRRCILLPHGNRERGAPSAERGAPGPGAARSTLRAEADSLSLAAHFLVADLTTPLGRSADIGRRERLVEAGVLPSLDGASSSGGLICQTFGIHRVVWPRQVLVAEAARRLCKRLVVRWMSKDPAPVREPVQDWLRKEWLKQELGVEAAIRQLQEACEFALKKEPETVFAKLIEPVAAFAAPARSASFSTQEAAETLGELEKLLGKPQAKESLARPDRTSALGVLEENLYDAGEALAGSLGQKMAELAVSLIEQPAFRLAGAEEAIRQITTALERILQHHEGMARELAERAFASYCGIHTLLRNFPPATEGRGAVNKRFAPALAQLLELLRTFAKSRYQSLVIQRVIVLYVSLRGQLSDQMREVGFCRNRLSELCKSFDSGPVGGLSGQVEQVTNPGRCLLPLGCGTPEEAVGKLLETIKDGEMQDLDQRVECVIHRDFNALVHVCLGSVNLLRNVETAMLKEAEALLGERLVGTNVVDMYLSQHQESGESSPESGDRNPEGEPPLPPEDAVLEEISKSFDAAQPDLAGLAAAGRMARPAEVSILVAPCGNASTHTQTCRGAGGPAAGPAKPHLKDLAREAYPNQDLLFVDTEEQAANEILYYREETCLALADLKLLGPAGQEAYRQMNTIEHFTPHARIDITDWHPAGGS